MGGVLSPYFGIHAPAASDISFTTGESVASRLGPGGSLQLTTQVVAFSYFTAQRTETVAYVTTYSNSTALTGGSYAAVGVYTVDGSGNLTKVIDTGDLHTTIWASTFTTYVTALTASFTKVAGQKYAVGFLAVGSGPPKIQAYTPAGGLIATATPSMITSLAAQSTLPASVTAGSLGVTTYFQMPAALLSPTSTP